MNPDGGRDTPDGEQARGLDRLADGGARVRDPDRVAAVRATGLLDTPAEPAFDDLARLAAQLTGMPLTFVSVVDDQRSYWKAVVGVDVDPVDTEGRQNPVEESFCQYLVTAAEPVVVSDAAAAAAYRDNTS